VELARLNELLAKRRAHPTTGETAFGIYMARSANPPYRTREDAMNSPEFAKLSEQAKVRLETTSDPAEHYEYLLAREKLMSNLFQVMADHRLDAIVHKSVEHQPTLIADGVKPPWVNMRGVPHINTFLIFVSSVVVPSRSLLWKGKPRSTRWGAAMSAGLAMGPCSAGVRVRSSWAASNPLRWRWPQLVDTIMCVPGARGRSIRELYPIPLSSSASSRSPLSFRR